MEYRCENCPLKKYEIDHVKCASESKPHPRYCQLAGNKYDEIILTKSINIYNEKIKKEGLPLISIASMKKFGKAMFKWAKGGFKTVPEKIYNDRLSLCNQCEYKTDVNGLDQCSLCTCIIKEKCATNTESCPIKKWDVYNLDSGTKGGCGCGKSN